MVKMPVNNQTDIFDSKEIVKRVDHTALSDRVKALEDKYGDDSKLAKSACEALKNYIPTQELVKSIFLVLLQSDDFKNKVLEIIKGSDKNVISEAFKRFGVIIYGGFGALLLLIAQSIFHKYFGL